MAGPRSLSPYLLGHGFVGKAAPNGGFCRPGLLNPKQQTEFAARGRMRHGKYPVDQGALRPRSRNAAVPPKKISFLALIPGF